VLFTHTRWNEAPRIRHQIAHLIAGAGHRVIFVERVMVSTGHCNTSSGQMTPTKGGLHGIGTILEADT